MSYTTQISVKIEKVSNFQGNHPLFTTRESYFVALFTAARSFCNTSFK